MTVSKRLRYEILRRDNHTCRYCGRSAPDATLTVDHVVATTLGGKDDPSNLVAACSDCNSGKSATPAGAPLIADVAQDALRWAAAMQQLRDAAVAGREEQIEIEKAVWAHLEPVARIPVDWFDTIGRFLSEGLHRVEIIDAAQTASALRYGDPWRYFCGIGWKKIRARQEQAAEMLRQAEPPPHTANPHCDANEDCPAHGPHNVPCSTCGEMDCDWFCGIVAGRDHVERNRPKPLPEDVYAAGLYSHLSLVVDGPIQATA